MTPDDPSQNREGRLPTHLRRFAMVLAIAGLAALLSTTGVGQILTRR